MNWITRLFGKFRGEHYSRHPVTGEWYSLPDEVRNAFVPVETTPETQDAFDALAEAMEQAKGEGRPCVGHFYTSKGEIDVD